jgi:hypothetical protein
LPNLHFSLIISGFAAFTTAWFHLRHTLPLFLDHLRKNICLPPRVRAVDMRHVLLVLPFLMHDLLVDEVAEHNSRLPAHSHGHVVDPSAELSYSYFTVVVSLVPSPIFS